jgi:hypothetical protein
VGEAGSKGKVWGVILPSPRKTKKAETVRQSILIGDTNTYLNAIAIRIGMQVNIDISACIRVGLLPEGG